MQQFKHRLAGLGCMHGPIAHGCPVYFHPKPRKLLLLAVKGEGIAKFCCQNVRQKACGGNAFGNDLFRWRRYFYCCPFRFQAFAFPAGIFGANMADDPNNCRYDIEFFTDILADLA
jgi:hypothetical protein